MTELRRLGLFGSISALVMTPVAALAQQQAAEDEADSQTYAADQMELEEIVVTGRVGGGEVTKFESAVAITTFNSESLREEAPISAAELFSNIPGFFSEASGGVVGNNVFPRGLPQPGSFRFLKLQEDGLPIMEVQELAFVNADTLVRIDDTLERMEAVRGGTSSIFASNAAGGIINHITRKGTQDFEGSARLEWGDFDHFRFDGSVSGPISDDVMFAAGGFWRSDDGIRDPGFRANTGGQFRANLTTMLDRGSIDFRFKVVDEENIFYLPVPLQRDGNNLSSIPGFDANEDTLTTEDARFASLLRPGGNVANRDLQDGVNTDYVQLGGKFEYELGDGWIVSNNFRFTDGNVGFNAIFSLSNPESASGFLEDAVSQLQTAGFESVSQARLQFATSDENVMNPGGLNGNGLVIESGWWAIDTEFENIINDFQINREFDLGAFGRHSLTGGFYFSDVDVSLNWNFNSVLQEVRGQPRLLDVIGQDAAGNDVARLTLNGFTSFGDFYRNSVQNMRIAALYGFDEWQVTDNLRVDVGFRYEDQDLDGRVEQLQDFSLEDNPLSPEQSGGLPTLADDSGTFGAGVFTPFAADNNEASFAIGANYTFAPWIATYARFNTTNRTPDFDDFNGNPEEGFPVQTVRQFEGGVKLDTEWFRTFVTFFYSELTDIPFNDEVVDPETGEIITLDLRADSENLGMEAEGVLGPFMGAEVAFNVTYQDPEFKDFAENSGNQVVRVPELIANIKPGYNYRFGDISGKAFLDISYVGDRFTDFGNTNVLPNYTTVGAGFTAFYDNFVLRFRANNLTDTIGLTEGNPRADQVNPNIDANLFSARPILGRHFRVSLGYEF